MKNITKKDYNEFVFNKMPKSSVFIKAVRAFVFGGLFCVAGQILMGIYEGWGLDEKHVATLTSITMILIGGLLTGFNVYDNIAKVAGAGTIVPITGFANSIVSPAMEFKSEGYVLGLGAKMFVIAGPVLVYGITASVFCGLIYALVKGVGLF